MYCDPLFIVTHNALHCIAMCAKPFSRITVTSHSVQYVQYDENDYDDDVNDDDDHVNDDVIDDDDDDDDDGVADGLLLEARTQLVLTLKAGTSGQLKQATVRT